MNIDDEDLGEIISTVPGADRPRPPCCVGRLG